MAIELVQHRASVRAIDSGDSVITVPAVLYKAPVGGGLVKGLTATNNGKHDAVVYIRCFSDRWTHTQEYRRLKLTLTPGISITPWENDIILEEGDQIVVMADADLVRFVLNAYEGFPPYVTSARLTVIVQGTQEGRWSMDGGNTWLTSASILDLPPGLYTITFKPVVDYLIPPSQTVQVFDVGAHVKTVIYYKPGIYKYHCTEYGTEDALPPVEMLDVRTLKLGGYGMVLDGRLYDLPFTNNPYSIDCGLSLKSEDIGFTHIASSLARFTQHTGPKPMTHANANGDYRLQHGPYDEFCYAIKDNELYAWGCDDDIALIPIKERTEPTQASPFDLNVAYSPWDGNYTYISGTNQTRLWEMEEAEAVKGKIYWNSSEGGWVIEGYLWNDVMADWQFEGVYAVTDQSSPWMGGWVVIDPEIEDTPIVNRVTEEGEVFGYYPSITLSPDNMFIAYSGKVGNNTPLDGQAMVVATTEGYFVFKHGLEETAQILHNMPGGRAGRPITFDWCCNYYHGRDDKLFYLTFGMNGVFLSEVEIRNAELFIDVLSQRPAYIPLHIVGDSYGVYGIDWSNASSPAVGLVEGTANKTNHGQYFNWNVHTGSLLSKYSIGYYVDTDNGNQLRHYLLDGINMYPLSSADNTLGAVSWVKVFYNNVLIDSNGSVFACHAPATPTIVADGLEVPNPHYGLLWHDKTARPLNLSGVSGTIVDTNGIYFINNSNHLYKCDSATLAELPVHLLDDNPGSRPKLRLVDDTVHWTFIEAPVNGVNVKIPVQYLGD